MSESPKRIEHWANLPDRDWVAVHVPRFIRVRKEYEAYERFLNVVLKQACRRLAPLAIVETRAKKMPSFAEKILRKRKLYVDPKDPLLKDPLVRMTDLCGGRVVTQTSEQVHDVCRFIEEAFDIDWPNSEDVSQRLRPTEFGYRSVHYIVTVNPGKLKAAGIAVPVPSGIIQPKQLKAEIQVRTLLEHAWADIGHDMTYKTESRIPDRIHRQFATLAATLESVDREFGRLVSGLQEFKSNFGAYHTRAEVEAEIGRLRIVLSQDPDNLDSVVKIARLALAIGRHELALDILNPYQDRRHQGLLAVRGITLTEMYEDLPESPGYIKGRSCLEEACALPPKDAETLCALAESWRRKNAAKARGFFHEAATVDGSDPVTLCRYIEFEIAHLSSGTIVEMVGPMIRNAMDRCRKQIEARVNLPWAWASLAMFHLLLKEPFPALDAVAQVARLCEPVESGAVSAAGRGSAPRRPCAAGRALRRTREALTRIACIRDYVEGFEWCERALLLALAVRGKDADAATTLGSLASWGAGKPYLPTDQSIVIFTGGCASATRAAMAGFKPYLLRACAGLSFTLLSGGTTSGISGLAGDVAEQSRGKITAFGYLPRLLPRGVREDIGPHRFARLINSRGSDFTPLDPLQGWTDLVVAGADLKRVKLLSYAGGRISNAECALALALGVHVGVVQNTTLPRERQFSNPDWQDATNLVKLPMDAMTIRAFLLVHELPCERPEFEMAARKAHEEYMKSAIPREPSLLPWDSLSNDLKLSNFHQIVYAESILKGAGLGIRPITDHSRPPLKMGKVIGDDGIRRLAEMEHGRWNVERLLLGWRYAEKKDVAKKLSPYLVAWDQVPAEIQKYDVDAIRTLPEKFREAGLEVYKLSNSAQRVATRSKSRTDRSRSQYSPRWRSTMTTKPSKPSGMRTGSSTARRPAKNATMIMRRRLHRT